MYEILRKRNTAYYVNLTKSFNELGEIRMNPEIRELNRMICKKCNEKNYEKCRDCKVFQLINKIAAG